MLSSELHTYQGRYMLPLTNTHIHICKVNRKEDRKTKDLFQVVMEPRLEPTSIYLYSLRSQESSRATTTGGLHAACQQRGVLVVGSSREEASSTPPAWLVSPGNGALTADTLTPIPKAWLVSPGNGAPTADTLTSIWSMVS